MGFYPLAYTRGYKGFCLHQSCILTLSLIDAMLLLGLILTTFGCGAVLTLPDTPYVWCPITPIPSAPCNQLYFYVVSAKKKIYHEIMHAMENKKVKKNVLHITT